MVKSKKKLRRTNPKIINLKYNKQIVEKFLESSKQIRSEIEEIRNVTTHPSLKGYLIEEVLRKFLQNHLPSSLGISRGIIHDADGNMSNEIDIVIFDAHQTPIFYQLSDVRIIPVETVYAVIEVKAKFDLTELRKTFEHMKSIRKLKKRAYTNPLKNKLNIPVYGKFHEIWPINYFVFAEDSINLSLLRNHIDGIHKSNKLPPEFRIDTVCVLNEGLITNSYDKEGIQLSIIPGKITELLTSIPNDKNKNLLLFLALLVNLLINARMVVNIKFSDYLPSVIFKK